jgi:hypothetical protein
MNQTANCVVSIWNANASPSPTDTNYMGFGHNANVLRYQVVGTAQSHVFHAGTTELARLTGTGRLGIGTAAPAFPLDVTGAARVSGSLTANDMTVSNVTSPILTFPTNTNNFTLVNSSTTNVSRFDATGNFVTIGNITSFGSISDERFKTNITDMDGKYVMNVLKKLRTVDFEWNDLIECKERVGTKDWGLIAQEVREVMPDIVDVISGLKKEDMMVIRYEKLIPYLLKAVQMLSERVDL